MTAAALRMTVLCCILVFRAGAQNSAYAYPWRLSNFPYVTASPNDGVMLMYRGVFFRQSRWDDRASIHDQVSLEGGYSTKKAWLIRARGDFPRLGDGWRLQAIGEVTHSPHYMSGYLDAEATRLAGSVELTRRLYRKLHVALRGGATRVSFDSDPTSLALTIGPETDWRGRVALLYDGRDREYDTRSGVFAEGGIFGGSAAESYLGAYGQVKGWLSLNEKTRVTFRGATRRGGGSAIDAARVIPAWEDEFVAGGGPESNRGLPTGIGAFDNVVVLSGELRHDVKVFPAGAIAVLGFVDATSKTGETGLGLGNLVPAVGGGIAIRLLRNAILTATVGIAQSKARVYVSSGWSW